MKKVLFGLFISILMIGSVLAGANTTNLIINNNKNINLFEINDGEIIITIPVGDYEIFHSDKGDEVFIENFGRNLIPGKPNLPSKIFSIAIPPGAILKDVTFNSGESIILDGNYDIQPVDLPRVIGQEDHDIYKQDQMAYNENYVSVYGNDNPYPDSIVEFVQTAGFRKYNLVDIRVNPFSYRPISGELTLNQEIIVTISYTFSDGFTYDYIMVDNIEKTKQLGEKIVYNYDQAEDWYPEGAGSKEVYDYVIITLDSLTSSVTPLVEWEEAKGRSVNVVTTSWIDSNYNGYDLAEKIRNFLREKYPSEEWGILDVCIVGHWNDIPIRTCSQYAENYYGPTDTDLYYAELSLPDDESWDADGDHLWGEDSDPIDFYSEVNVGRIPWSDPDIVKNICIKSVAYEMNTNPSFKRNILLLGAFFWSDTDNAVLMEYKTDPELHPWMEDWTMTKMYEEESSYTCDYNLSYGNVITVWSESRYAFVDWAGHGSPTACYEYYPSQPFVDTDTCEFLNDDYPAIIFASACSNSDTEYDNIGQMMMKQGAVGFLGSTEVAYGIHGWNDPYDGYCASFDYFFTTCCTSGEYTQGQAQQYALLEMYTKGLWPWYTKYQMFEWGALWGNPDISMANVAENEPPTVPEIDGPNRGVTGIEYCWTFQSIDDEGENIMYTIDWDDGNVTETECIPPNSSIELCHTYTEKGYFNIKAKAKECTLGQESEWSYPFLFIVPRERISTSSILLKLLERFFYFFPFLERLII